MSSDFEFVTIWRVPGTVAEVQAVLSDGRTLPRWWPSVYLSVEPREPGDAEHVDSVTDLHTKGWLPYTLRWSLTLTEPITATGFALSAAGDLNGTGRWTFVQDGPEVVITYDWRVSATKPLLRRFHRVLRPLFAANHRWAMARGEESLRLELRRQRAATEAERAAVPAPPGPTFSWVLPRSRDPRRAARTTGTAPPAPRQVGGTAVVVGASMAGLCAARVLSERFGHVLVLDRDVLPEGPQPRGQVPQGRHPHLLLVAGARVLEGWFPGLGAELVAAGAVDVDVSGDVYWHQSGGASRHPASTLRGPAMSRPFLERTVRRRVESLPNVTVRDETAVRGLRVDPSGERVTAVELADGSLAPCDLVIDASGRSARSLTWLSGLGFPPPPVSVVQIDTRYVTRAYTRSASVGRDWKVAAVIDDPRAKRMASVFPIEGGRALVTFAGLNGAAPPTDETERRAWARSLPSPVVAEFIESSEPHGAPVTHRFPANQRRHVERMRRFPLGWVLLGDAVCSFDPIYGQGMSSAALQAVALATCLDRAEAIDRTFARRYFSAVSRTVAVPWSIAVGADFLYDGTTGPKPLGTDLLNRYLERARIAGQHDDAVALGLVEVFVLVRHPGALVRPGFVLRVLRGARRGPAGRAEGVGFEPTMSVTP